MSQDLTPYEGEQVIEGQLVGDVHLFLDGVDAGRRLAERENPPRQLRRKTTIKTVEEYD